MAALNEILVGRFNGLLTRLLKITGGAPAPQLTPEVQPILQLISDSADLAFLKEEFLMVFGATTSNVALKQSYVQVANPSNSGLLIIIEGITVSADFSTPTAVQYGFGLTTPSTRAVQRVVSRDSRVNPGLASSQSGPGACTFGSDAVADGVAGIAFNQARVDLLSFTSLYLPVKYVIEPGDAFSVWCEAVNIPTTASIFYRARAAQQAELV